MRKLYKSSLHFSVGIVSRSWITKSIIIYDLLLLYIMICDLFLLYIIVYHYTCIVLYIYYYYIAFIFITIIYRIDIEGIYRVSLLAQKYISASIWSKVTWISSCRCTVYSFGESFLPVNTFLWQFALIPGNHDFSFRMTSLVVDVFPRTLREIPSSSVPTHTARCIC